MLDPERARRIRVLALDVDGVLTDNAVFVGDFAGTRVEFKRFDVQDGLGIALLRGTAIEVIWVTGRRSADTAHRADELKVATMVQVPPDQKLQTVSRLLEERGLGWEALAYVGDDLADLPVLERAGLPIAVANARDIVKAAARHVTTAGGGHGAVREVIDDLLEARGEWEAAKRHYLGQDRGPA